MTMSEQGRFVCDGCGETFEYNIATRLDLAHGADRKRFHSPACMEAWRERHS